MQKFLAGNRGLAVLSDLYMDRLIYVSILLAALMAASYVNSL